MRRSVTRLLRSTSGAVAPTVALSLFGLIAAGGIAFDYAHLEALHTEVQSAADQAALAAASQLDGQSGACARAAAAAASMLNNKAVFANGSASTAISVADESTCDDTGKIKFYQSYDESTDTPGSAATDDSNAAVVVVQVDAKQAAYALTPIVNVFSSGDIDGTAIASVGHAICKTPPVMVCNPNEPSTNTDVNLAFTPTPGVGLKLVTGDATVPGNFGWLESDNGPGANNLAEQLGYNTPLGNCQPETGVTTETGMDASVLNAYNTRFDVYANGNTSCPSQDGGTCSPSDVTRKDLVCGTTGANPTSCKSSSTWSEAGTPYRLPTQSTTTCTTGSNGKQTCNTTTASVARDLTTGDTYPTIMGYPPDECHMSPSSGSCGITGDGNWDRNAYFRVNYGWDSSTWQTQTGLSPTVANTASNYASRYNVYKWERANPTVGGKGIGVPQQDGSGNNYAFGEPATGHTGVSPTTSQADRRVIAVAVLNCQALQAKGKTTDVPVATWMDVFLVQPALTRKTGNQVIFSDKNIYVEEIGTTTASASDITAQVVRRDKPYLIK